MADVFQGLCGGEDSCATTLNRMSYYVYVLCMNVVMCVCLNSMPYDVYVSLMYSAYICVCIHSGMCDHEEVATSAHLFAQMNVSDSRWIRTLKFYTRYKLAKCIIYFHLRVNIKYQIRSWLR